MTTQTWDAFGDPDDARLTFVLDADQKGWTYAYHVLGDLRTVTSQDSRTRTWLYNSKHLLWQETHPESGTITYSYDGFGRLTSKMDANNITTTYTYDANNRPQTITSGSRVTSIGYEPDSELRQWTSVAALDDYNKQIGATYSLFLYDGAGRNTSRMDFIDGKTFTTGYDYDENDTLVAIRYPTLNASANRREIGYERQNAEHRITRVFDKNAVRTYASQFDYHPSGAVKWYKAGNNLNTQIDYDQDRYWVQSITAGTFHTQYTYDYVGNVATTVDDLGRAQVFQYDALDRLKRVDATGGYPTPSLFEYDLHGNQQSIPNGTTYTYDLNTLRLASQGTNTFTYDANGNVRTVTGPSNRTFQYTAENWLQTATVDGAVTAYAYDADGWRMKKTTATSVTYYLRGVNGELLTEWTNPGATGAIRDYVYADSRLLSVVVASSTLDSGDIVAPIIAGGVPMALTMSATGQNARLMFNGASGQTITITVTTQFAMSSNWTFSLLAPDGSTVTTITPASGTTATLGPQLLSQTGTYVVFIDPFGTATGTLSIGIANATSGAPMISGFTPGVGPAGTSVAITGTNLQVGTQIPIVLVNGTSASITSLSPFTITVPARASSGRISVQTTAGRAVSATDLFIAPSPYIAGDVADTGRLNFGVARAVTLSTANRVALLVFDRAAGQRFFVKLTNQTMTSQHMTIYRPDGAVHYTNVFTPSAATFVEPNTASMSGTYTMLIDPDAAYTGSVTVTVYDVAPDVSGSMVPNGTPVTLVTTTPGQNAELTFFGNAGQRIALTLTNSTVQQKLATLQAPDGTTVIAQYFLSWDGAIDATVLPLTGQYRVLVNPQFDYAGTTTFTLYDVPPDFTDVINTDNSPLTVSTPAPFQKAFATFTGTVSQRIAVTTGNGTYGNATNVSGWLLDPNGASLAFFNAGTSAFVDTKILPANGTYTLKLDPTWLSTGSLVARVSTVPDDVTGTIAPGGSSVTVTTVAAGQNALLTFSGTANQRISVLTTSGMYGSNCNANLSVLKPDQSALVVSTCAGVAAFIDTKVLPVAGTYTIKLDPVSTNTGSVTITLYDVPSDPAVTVTVGGGAQTVTTTVPGQNASATFSGTSGQQATVRLTNNGMGATTVRLNKPDGTQLTSSTSSNASFNLATQTLPISGTYSITIDPSSANTGSISVSVTSP